MGRNVTTQLYLVLRVNDAFGVDVVYASKDEWDARRKFMDLIRPLVKAWLDDTVLDIDRMSDDELEGHYHDVPAETMDDAVYCLEVAEYEIEVPA